MNIIICIPSSIDWKDYKKELDTVEKYGGEMFYKVSHLPKEDIKRCYVAHKGTLVGWMEVSSAEWHDKFICSTTGTHWPAGYYIGRRGKFHYIKNGLISCKSFRGFKYLPEDID